jgi:hypothetical protein
VRERECVCACVCTRVCVDECVCVISEYNISRKREEVRLAVCVCARGACECGVGWL